MNRHVLSIVVVILCAGCRHVENTPVPVVNLLREVDHAEKRPPNGFEIAALEVDGQPRPSIVAPVPSRLTIPLPLPRRGVLRAFVSLDPNSTGAVRLRVGVSDNRIYERLTDIDLSPGDRRWIPVQTDLSAYAGWKWSLFYHPERIVWHVVLAADAMGGGPARALWGSPEIVTDKEAAKEYSVRRQQFR
ncbi:MAG TPA: hypothetical protein VL882_24385 [Vicinamibacterales bacterium]|jgi:hypothetical protein|nr:hypothetical protein [Vicinamibacterales bacterium]